MKLVLKASNIRYTKLYKRQIILLKCITLDIILKKRKEHLRQPDTITQTFKLEQSPPHSIPKILEHPIPTDPLIHARTMLKMFALERSDRSRRKEEAPFSLEALAIAIFTDSIFHPPRSINVKTSGATIRIATSLHR